MEIEKEVWMLIDPDRRDEPFSDVNPRAVCGLFELRSTAEATALGLGLEVVKVKVFRSGNYWYGPVNIIEPTAEDLRAEANRSKQEAAVSRALELGLKDDELDLIAEARSARKVK